MNKTAISTILGSALLATLKRKGSSTTENSKMFVELVQENVYDFYIDVDVDIDVEFNRLKTAFTEESRLRLEKEKERLDNILNNIDYEELIFERLGVRKPKESHVETNFDFNFVYENEEYYIDHMSKNPEYYEPGVYDFNDLSTHQKIKKYNIMATIVVTVIRGSKQEPIPESYFEYVSDIFFDSHYTKDIKPIVKKIIEEETGLTMDIDGLANWVEYEDTINIYKVENGEKIYTVFNGRSISQKPNEMKVRVK